MKKVFALLFVASIIVTACKKYKEDPFISLRCPEKRLEGKWFLTNYTLNGKGMMHIYGAHGLFPVFEFIDRRPENEPFCSFSCNNCFDTIIPVPIDSWHQTLGFGLGEAHFYDNYKKIGIYPNNPYLSKDSVNNLKDTSAFLNFSIKWEIKKLTNKDMCLYAKYKDDINILTFEKQ